MLSAYSIDDLTGSVAGLIVSSTAPLLQSGDALPGFTRLVLLTKPGREQ
jgi:hypothetical protein